MTGLSRARSLSVESFAARVGDELELHAPRGQEVHPALALARPFARGRLAEHLHAASPHVAAGCVEIVDVQGDVMPAVVAVARQHLALVRCRVLEYLEDRLAAAAEEM